MPHKQRHRKSRLLHERPTKQSDRKSRRLRVLDTLTRNTEKRTEQVCDVTLADFANAEVKTEKGGGGGGSLSMRVTKRENLTTAINKLTIVTDNDERPWDERDDDDDGEEGRGIVCSTRDHKRRRRVLVKEEEGGGTDYPIDLWFLISEHIRPEDVGRFASLCHATHYITTTVRFWLTMFRRYYHWSATLPASLNYWNLDHRIKDVRVCVIRALFFMYAPFCLRIAAEKPLSADPTQLLRAQCLLQWHKKEGKQHKYYFKFAHPEHSTSWDKKLRRSMGDSCTQYNPHSGCWVLEATSVNVCAVPMVMGEYLYHTGLRLSANLCSHCLHLSLVPAHLLPHSAKAPAPRHRVPATEINLDPVSNVRLYPWWHPQYCHLLELSDGTHKDEW